MAKARVEFSNGDTFDVEGMTAGEVIQDYIEGDYFIRREAEQYTYWNKTHLVKVYDLEPGGGGERHAD